MEEDDDEVLDCKMDSGSMAVDEDDDEALDCKLDSDGTVFDSQSFLSHLLGVLNWHRWPAVSARRR